MKVKLFPSFSSLLILLKRGFSWEDSDECIYMFGCMHQAIDQTFEDYTKHIFSFERILSLSEIKEKLDKAESEGRLLWREEVDSTVGAETRMLWLISKLGERGVHVGEEGCTRVGYHNAGWNLPTLIEWAVTYVSDLAVVHHRFGRGIEL